MSPRRETRVGPGALLFRERAARPPKCIFQHLSPTGRVEEGKCHGMLHERGNAWRLPSGDESANLLDLIAGEAGYFDRLQSNRCCRQTVIVGCVCMGIRDPDIINKRYIASGFREAPTGIQFGS